jgi:hypothetical protein
MAKKKQAPYPAPETYPTAAPARDSQKTIGPERNVRGKFHPVNIEATAKRAAGHMQKVPPRSRTYGASERHAIDARDGDGGPATGAFRVPLRTAKTERLA